MLKVFVSLFAIWLIFSGFFEPFFLAAGFISCVTVYSLLVKYTNITFHKPSLKWGRYLLWLFYQMIISGLAITKIVWKKNPNIFPEINKIQHHQKGDKIAVLAHSITLTPGTLTVSYDEKYLYIHSIIKDPENGINDIIKQVS